MEEEKEGGKKGRGRKGGKTQATRDRVPSHGAPRTSESELNPNPSDAHASYLPVTGRQ